VRAAERGACAPPASVRHASACAALMTTPAVQSYGGHYVPAVSAAILAHNRGRGADAAINLVGIAIGNGLTDPAKQYSLYADFSASKGLIGETLRVSINTARPPPPPKPPAAPARLRRPLRPCAARTVLPHLQRPHPDVQLVRLQPAVLPGPAGVPADRGRADPGAPAPPPHRRAPRA